MSDDRSWMYKRIYRGRIVNEFVDGVDRFLDFAYAHPERVDGDKIRCPSNDCCCLKWKNRRDVKACLLRYGFQFNYSRWTQHGEPYIPPQAVQNKDMEDNALIDSSGMDNMREMLIDAMHPEFEAQEQHEDEPNEEARDFYKMLKDAEEPLWHESKNYTKLSAVTRLQKLKSDHRWSNRSFNAFLKLIKEKLQEDANLPNTYYEMNGMMKKIGLQYEEIHACINDCMLYWGDDVDVDDESEDDDMGEDDDQAEEEEREVVTPGTSVSSVGNTTITKSGWIHPPNWKKRGRSKMVKVSTHRLILKYGKQHFFPGSIRTLINTIYKAYCPGPYHSWRQWKDEDKLFCWEKFKEYFFVNEDQNEDKPRELFEAYGRANWTKFLYNARKKAKKANKHYKKDPNAKSPVIWISDSNWRELCKIWSNKKWRMKSKKAKDNRTKEDPDNPKLLISTSGNKPLEQRLYEERDETTGELPDQLRMFELGYKKRNGEWSTPCAQEIGEGYKQKLDAAADEIISSTGSARPSNSELDSKLEIYREVKGVTNKKGHIVGFGRSHSAPS